MRSIKTKMTLVTSLLMAGTLSVLAFFFLAYFDKQFKKTISNQQFTMVSALADQIDDKLRTAQSELTAVAGTISPEILADPVKAQKFISGRPDTLAMFDNGVFLFSPIGKLIAGSPLEPHMLSRDYSSRDYFKKTMATRKPQISEPFLSAQSHRHPIIALIAPIFDARGEITAILGGGLDLLQDNFLGKLATIKVGEHGYLYLFNTFGTMIIHPDRGKILRQYGPPDSDSLFEKAMAGFEGTGETVISPGVHAIASYKRLKSTNWIIASMFPQSEAYAPVYQAKRYFLLALAVVLAVSVLIVWLFMKHLAAPLVSFTNQVREIARGKVACPRVRIETRDEIGLLANAFNLMLAELGAQEDKLRKLSLAVEQSPNTVVITDVDGSIEYVNPRFTELTGYAAEEVIGRNPRILQCGTAPEQYRSMWETITAGREWRGEFRNRKKNGECYWESASISPVKDEDGTIKHFIAIKEDITEKKLAEEQIRQALSLLSATLESTADGILVRDLAGKVITCNRKFVEIWRIPESLLATGDERKMRMYVLGQLKDPQRFLEITENLYVRPDIESCDLLEFKDGRIIERVSKPQIIGDEIVGRVISFRDITERTRAEVELGKVNRALRTLSACNRALVYATDERSLLVEICRSIVNNGGYQFAWVGYPLDDEAKNVTPTAWAGHEDGYLDAIQVTWSDSASGSGPVGTAIRTGAPSIVRDTAIDGNFILWEEEARKRGYSSVIGLPLTNGKTFAALAIYASETDAFDPHEVELLRELASNLSYGISALRMGEERIKAERALHESEERYRSLIENIDLGITLIDHNFRIIMTNSAVSKLFNKPLNAFAQKECFREFEKRAAACPHCAGRVSLETGKPATVETEGIRDDGNRFQVRINTFPVFAADGKTTHFIEVIQDITEQKRAEAEKRQLEQQLRQSQKMEALGTLAGGVAHDFNNILTAITGYCTLIERKCGGESPVRGYLAKLLASTDRAAALTRSLLAYSRKQPHDPQPVDLNAIIGKIDTLLSRLLGEDIELAVRPADGPLTVLADGMQIEQVLMNLATNARDAMPEGGILHIAADRAEIDTEFVKAHGYGLSGGYALITVSDTGCGMDEQTRERIFEPFFTTKEVGRGTGLGLSIAYGIVKQHSGYINAYSEPGRGTTFTIYLPLTDREKEESPSLAPSRPTGGSETILLVEDDAEIRATLREILEEEGYGVIEAADGEEGIGKFCEHADEVQLLILDVVMPKKNGKAVHDEIRAVRPGIRAIFVSGYTADILNAKGILQDDLNFICKPIVINKLLDKVREVLDQ